MGDVIKKRTVFYDNTGGVVRPRDWAMVVTTLGTMWEPRCGFFLDDPDGAQIDYTDEITRVDEMKQVQGCEMNNIMSNFDTENLIGGNLTWHAGP